MKHIVRNPYDLWAHEAQSWAANSTRNQSFDGAIAKSYAATIAKIVRNKKNERAYMVSNRSWSSTTNGHQSALRRAIPSGSTIFHVYDPSGTTAEHVKEYMERITDLAGKVQRARSNKEWRQAELLRTVEELRTYVTFFKVKGVKVPDETAIDGMRKELEAYQAKENARVRAEEKKRLADAKEKLVKWLAGENVYIPRDLGTDFLRIRPSDPTTVETTRGSDVPLEHVQRALPVVLRKLRAKEAWHTNGETIRLGHYSVTRISADGVLTVGCHSFTRAEIERFAEVLKTLAA